MASIGFIHTVYFYLANPASPTDAAELAAGCRTYLSAIPGVLRLDVGFPAGTPRVVVDNSYGVGLIVQFTDSAAHDVYQEHPEHIRFIEAMSRLWARVQVYDTVVAA